MTKLFDFYYSHTQAQQQGGLCHTVNGKLYTEMIDAGQKPISRFDDLTLVASATEERAVTYNQERVRRNAKKFTFS